MLLSAITKCKEKVGRIRTRVQVCQVLPDIIVRHTIIVKNTEEIGSIETIPSACINPWQIGSNLFLEKVDRVLVLPNS